MHELLTLSCFEGSSRLDCLALIKSLNHLSDYVGPNWKASNKLKGYMLCSRGNLIAALVELLKDT